MNLPSSLCKPLITLALFALAPFIAAAQVEVPAAVQPAADWASVVLCRFDASPLQLEGSGAGVSYIERIRAAKAEAKLVPGRFGTAIDFATTPTMLLHLPATEHPVDQLTVECWLNAQAFDGKETEVLCEAPGMWRLSLLRMEGGARLVWETRIDGVWTSLSTPVPVAEWHHVAGTFDGQTVRLLLNGKLIMERTHSGRIIRLNTFHRPLALGSDVDGAKKFHGALDEFRLSRIARTAVMDGSAIAAPAPTTTASIVPAPPRERRSDRPYHLHSTLRISKLPVAPAVDGKMDDPAWTGVADERFLETGIGFDNLHNWSTYGSVVFRAGYDRDNLYLVARVLEMTPKGVVADNPEIWQTNCLELYLQPGGYRTPYLQIAANPHGKNWSAQWTPRQVGGPHARDQKPLPVPGLRQAAVINGDTWTIELAIPFKDLGVETPEPGHVWRGNVAYSTKDPAQNLSWGYVWPLFYWQSMFPRIEFAGSEVPAAATHVLRGSLVDTAGKPVVWSNEKLGALDVGGRPVLTNSRGEFTITDLPAGRLTFRTLLPQYDRLDVTVNVRRPVEVLAPIVLEAGGMYASGFQNHATTGPVSLYQATVELPPDLPVNAESLRPLADLEYLATAGEFESRAFCILANTDVAAPRLELDPVFKSGAKELRLERAEPRWTQRVMVRDEDNVSPEESSYIWRYLRSESPSSLRSGDLRHVVVIIKLPDDTVGGTYTGTMRLMSGTTALSVIPVSLTVPTFHLVEPKKQVGFYHWQRSSANGGAIMSDADMRRDYKFMRELGASQLMAADQHLRPNTTDPWVELRHGIELQKEAGFGPYYITVIKYPWQGLLTSDKEAERAHFKEMIDGLDKLEDELGLKRDSIVLTFGDEIQRWGPNTSGWITWSKRLKGITKRKNYMTLQLENEGKAKDLYESIMEQTDIACFNGSPTDWGEHQASLAKTGTIGWFYPNSLTNTIYTRISNGYYLWGSPFQVSMPWCFYYCPSGDFFDNLNGSLPVWAYAAPHPDKPGEMIPALLAEAYREGYDDLRYLATLDAAINDAATRGGSSTVEAARTLLASYTGSSSIPRTYSTPITQPTPEDLRLRRLAIVTVVEALKAGK